MADKPAILQESEFVVEEGILHRVFRTGAIWLNKLFFSAAVLWILWLFIAYFQGDSACAGGLGHVGNNSTQDLDNVAEGTCSVFLTPTSKYLGAMTVISFILSVSMGMLGLVIGKRVIETQRAAEEVGARRDASESADGGAADAATAETDEDR